MLRLWAAVCAPQGLDWRDPTVQVCNAGVNPLQPGFNDGITGDWRGA